jgi:DNA invertase Pin-like site-specific DNA recombinase
MTASKEAPVHTTTTTPTTPAALARVRTIIAYTRSGRNTTQGQRRVQRQRTAIQAEADFQGWTIAAWTCDLGQPGTTLDRPGLRQALAVLSEHRADALVAYDPARLSRLPSQQRQLARLAERQGWQVLTVEALRAPAPA